MIAKKIIENFPELENKNTQKEFKSIKNGTHLKYIRVTKLPKVWHNSTGEARLIKILRMLNIALTNKWGMLCIKKAEYDKVKEKLDYYFIDHITTKEFMDYAKSNGVELHVYSCADWAKVNPDFVMKDTDTLWMKSYRYNKRAVEEYVSMLAGKHPKYIKLSHFVNETKPKKEKAEIQRAKVKRAMIKFGIFEEKIYNKLWITREEREKLLEVIKVRKK